MRFLIRHLEHQVAAHHWIDGDTACKLIQRKGINTNRTGMWNLYDRAHGKRICKQCHSALIAKDWTMKQELLEMMSEAQLKFKDAEQDWLDAVNNRQQVFMRVWRSGLFATHKELSDDSGIPYPTIRSVSNKGLQKIQRRRS